jgi:hypothetical protein
MTGNHLSTLGSYPTPQQIKKNFKFDFILGYESLLDQQGIKPR